MPTSADVTGLLLLWSQGDPEALDRLIPRVYAECRRIAARQRRRERPEHARPHGAGNATTLTMPSDRELVITRVFNAPPQLVFDAWTKPEHVVAWWGPRDTTPTVCEIDLRPGGAWRYVSRGANGEDYAFSGVYREIVPPGRLVYTEGFEAMPGHEYLVTATLEEHNGKTKMTAKLLYQNAADRDGHLNSGMERGMRETLDRLEEHLETMA